MSDIFWGIILTGLFTLTASLGGNLLANHYNSRRLDREREMSLRKDIYLAAAEAVSAGLLAIGRFANLDVPDKQLTEGYFERAPSVIKVHIIANVETVRAVVNFTVELNAAFFRLFARRLPLVLQKQQIAFLNGQRDSFTKEQSRMVELMKQYNMDGINDPNRWGSFQHIYDFERRRSEETTQAVDALNASLIPKHVQFLEEVIDESIKLGRLLTPALFSIRKELELPVDETEFRTISEEATAKQVESLKEFIRALQSIIATQIPATGGAPPPAA